MTAGTRVSTKEGDAGWVARKHGHSLRLNIAVVVIGIYVAAAAIGPELTGFHAGDPNIEDALIPPMGRNSSGSLYVLGTDWLGRSMAGELMAGARVSIVIGVAAVALAVVVGALVGVIAGYVGGVVETILMRVVDVQLAFPGIILAIFVAAALGRNGLNVVVALALAIWGIFARLARSEALVVQNYAYIEASKMLGASRARIICTELVPATVRSVSIYATVEFGFVVAGEAGLSFLGIGLPPSDASWGTTIAGGQDYLSSAWWVSTLPGLALAILVVCVSVVTDELTDADLVRHV